MGVDPHTDDVMARLPLRTHERVIDTWMWVGVVQMGLAMASTVLWFGELRKVFLRFGRPSVPAYFSAHERHHS